MTPSYAAPRAILFDLDGTLVDSASDLRLALNALLAERGREPIAEAAVRGMIGDGAARLVERGFRASGGLPAPLDDLTRRFVVLYAERLTVSTRPLPGVVDALSALAARGLRLGVCTNKPGALTRRLLADLDLARYFAAIAGGDEAPARKPDPRHVRHLLAALGATPEESLMVGDSANDVAAARAAGLRVFVVAGGYATRPADELGADAVLTSLGDILARLD